MTHSFPTRRSSELIAPGNAGCGRHVCQDSVRLCHVTTQQGFDAIATIHRIVVVKMQLRYRAQLEHLAEAETDFARAITQRLHRRSEERRVGKGGVRTLSTRWARDN